MYRSASSLWYKVSVFCPRAVFARRLFVARQVGGPSSWDIPTRQKRGASAPIYIAGGVCVGGGGGVQCPLYIHPYMYCGVNDTLFVPLGAPGLAFTILSYLYIS